MNPISLRLNPAGPGFPEPGLGPGARKNGPDETREAARQFESLLIGQLLKSAREGHSSGLTGESDSASGCAMDFAEEQLAALLAQKGGLGLATMLTAGLESEAEPGAASPARLDRLPMRTSPSAD